MTKLAKISKVVAGVALVAASGIANAGLSWTQLATSTLQNETFNPDGLAAGMSIDTPVSLGFLSSDNLDSVVFTYLGHESGYVNNFKLTVAPGTQIDTNATRGTTATLDPGSIGPLQFRFEGLAPNQAYNAGAWADNTSIALVGTNMTDTLGNSYQYVVGYNDSFAGGRDWDDMVIGVNAIPAIPEPETYAMLLAGLGLMGFIARRRRAKDFA